MKFYHGTSSKIELGKFLMPSTLTGVQREGRNKDLDWVFLTRSKVSAEMYARKACQRYGGQPVVIEAEPVGFYHEIHNLEVICPKAVVVN